MWDVLVSFIRTFLETPIDDLGEGAVDTFHTMVCCRRIGFFDDFAITFDPLPCRFAGAELCRGPPPRIRWRTREHRVDESTERINVGAYVGTCVSGSLFGCHVKERARGRACLAAQARLAEIRQPDLVVVVEEHVRRLQVAMKNGFAVQVHKRLGDLAKHVDHFFHRDRASGKTLGERASRKVLHDVVRRFGVPPDLEQMNDASLAEDFDELSHFPFEERPIETLEPREEFDRDFASRILLNRKPDFPVRARAKAAFHVVAGNFGLGELGAAILRACTLALVLNDGMIAVRLSFVLLMHQALILRQFLLH